MGVVQHTELLAVFFSHEHAEAWKEAHAPTARLRIIKNLGVEYEAPASPLAAQSPRIHHRGDAR